MRQVRPAFFYSVPPAEVGALPPSRPVRTIRDRRRKRLISRMLVFLGSTFPVVSLWALPPFIPIEKRVAASSIVLIADVVSSTSQNLNQTINSAVVQLHVLRVIKGPAGIPADLALQFVVYPESFEARMRTPPTQGRYFVFLNTVESRREEGGSIVLYQLYEPNPFAFAFWNEATEQKLIKILKEEKNR